MQAGESNPFDAPRDSDFLKQPLSAAPIPSLWACALLGCFVGVGSSAVLLAGGSFIFGDVNRLSPWHAAPDSAVSSEF